MEKSKGTTAAAAAATAAAAAVVADIRFIAKAKRAACAKRPFFALVTTDVKRKRHSSECCRLVTWLFIPSPFTDNMQRPFSWDLRV